VFSAPNHNVVGLTPTRGREVRCRSLREFNLYLREPSRSGVRKSQGVRRSRGPVYSKVRRGCTKRQERDLGCDNIVKIRQGTQRSRGKNPRAPAPKRSCRGAKHPLPFRLNLIIEHWAGWGYPTALIPFNSVRHQRKDSLMLQQPFFCQNCPSCVVRQSSQKGVISPCAVGQGDPQHTSTQVMYPSRNATDQDKFRNKKRRAHPPLLFSATFSTFRHGV